MFLNNIHAVTQNTEPNSILLPDGMTYTQKILSQLPNVIQLLPGTETSGLISYDASSQGNNGVYNGTTLAQINGPGASMGRFGFYDGVNDNWDIYSAGIDADFNGAEFSLGIWFRATSIVAGRIGRILADANNYWEAIITAGSLQTVYTSAGVFKTVSSFPVVANTFYHYGLTVSDSNDRMRHYMNGIQVGATQTGLGTWVGALSSSQCCYMARNTSGANPLAGYSGFGVIANVEWTPAQMLIAATAI
jgi:hypothetical protein